MNQNLSLFIPRVFLNISSERIKGVFESQGFGMIKRVDLVNQGHYNRVYIHFEEWNNCQPINDFQNRIMNKETVHIVYDDPFYWIVLENNNNSNNNSKKSQQRKIKINLNQEIFSKMDNQSEDEIKDETTNKIKYEIKDQVKEYKKYEEQISESEYNFVMESEEALEEFVHKDYVQILEKEIYELHQIIKNMKLQKQQEQQKQPQPQKQGTWKKVKVDDLFKKSTLNEDNNLSVKVLTNIMNKIKLN